MATLSEERTSTAPKQSELLERHGIDFIPPNERHGRAFSLLTFWTAGNAQLLSISVGALAVVLGLNLGWAVASILIGNAFGALYMALHSAQGPRLGIPQMMQSRAQFGMYGTALPNIIVVLMYIGYFTASAVLGGEAFRDLIHVTTAQGIIIFNFLNLLVVWFGYKLFHRFNRLVAWASLAIFASLLGIIVTKLPSHLPAGTSNTAGTILLSVSIFVAWQVTWAPYVSDYSRYLPEETSSWKTFIYTYIGSAVGASLVMVVGALAAIVAGNAINVDAPGYLAGLLSVKWLFLIIFILGVTAGSYPNLYGPFLTFFAIVSPSGKLASKETGRMARIVSTTIFALIGTIVAIEASANFMTDLTNFLVFTLYLLVPWTAINLTDFYVVRRGHYNIPELFKVNGIYGQFNWFALAVYVVAFGCEFPFMNSAYFVGPVSTSMGGADIAWIVGFVIASVAYYVGARYGLTGRLQPEAARGGYGAQPSMEGAPTP